MSITHIKCGYSCQALIIGAFFSIVTHRAFSLKDLTVSGNELMETVLDDPAQNTREALLEIAGKLREKLGA